MKKQGSSRKRAKENEFPITVNVLTLNEGRTTNIIK